MITNLNVQFEPNVGLEQIISADELKQEYIKFYDEIKTKYADYYRAGTGYKTNKYHEPVMNKAYNYIEHDDFKSIAKESVKGWDNNNQPKGEVVSYPYYKAVRNIVCDEISKKYNNQFILKFDHRYKDRKNNDFDGTIICYKNKSFWQNRNLPNKQRYYCVISIFVASGLHTILTLGAFAT